MPLATLLGAFTTGTSAAGRERDGFRLMVAGGLLLGTIGVFFVEAGADPLTAVWFRCAFGALTLLVWAALTGSLQTLRLQRAGAPAALVSGVLMLLNWVLFFEAVSRTSIGVATVVFHVQPVWVMALAAWCWGERITRRQLVAVAAALAGLALATGAFDQVSTAAALDDRYLVGIAICLAASLSYAGVTMIAKSTRTLTPLAMSFWQCAIGSIALAAWPLWHGLPAAGLGWGWLVGLGVVHTGLAYVVLYAGMTRLPAGRIALLQFVYPVTALVVDGLVYGHRPGPLQLVGVAVMGIALWGARRT
jgi:drug/metabolite transporter (DMT)-like permease